MKKLFIHHPLFRLLSPLFSGIVVYLLILLINNNVEKLEEQFLGEELYICIGLSFITQELSRLLLLVFKKITLPFSSTVSLVVQVALSLLLCISVVTVAIYLYFEYTFGYAPNSEELWLFNSIFCAVTLIYILLHISHEYLYKINTKKINDELIRKQLIEEDFTQFKNEINPDLLFVSLETILVLMKEQKNKVDDFIDHLAATYRYILSKNKRQLVLLQEELLIVDQLVQLFNYLPFGKVAIQNSISSKFLVVPGSLLKIIEYVVKGTISSTNKPLSIKLSETDVALELSYDSNDKLVKPFQMKELDSVKNIYDVYSSQSIKFEEIGKKRQISLPKLHIKS